MKAIGTLFKRSLMANRNDLYRTDDGDDGVWLHSAAPAP